MSRYLVVKDYETDSIHTKIDVTGKSDRTIERIENGMKINPNHVKFYIELIEEGWYCNECNTLTKEIDKQDCIECGCTEFTYKSYEDTDNNKKR